jgi:glycosyltransferase involved in cell wall biosynthesis
MTTVLHTEASRGWGGQEVRILTEVGWLQTLGWRVLLACQPGSGILSRASRASVPAIPLVMRASWDLRALIRLVALIRREKVGLVHTHSSIDGWLGGMAGRLAGVPVVRSRHVSIPIRRRWNPVYSLLADRIVASGDAVRRILIDAGVDPSGVVVLPSGVDLERFSPGPACPRVRAEFGLTGPVIGSVAMFRGSKGHAELLEAFDRLGGEVPDACLLLVGDGIRRRSVERLAEARGLGGRAVFTGFREDVPDLLRTMDCFVLASTRTEGVPQSLLQAMAVGCPVVASAVGGIPDVVQHGVNGLLVPPGDPAALAEAIRTVFVKPVAAREMAERGRALVHARFSHVQALERLDRLYRELICR